MLKDKLRRVNFYSQTLMLLTGVHHIYGAYVYNTPWRLHVLFLSIPVIVVSALLAARLAKTEALRKDLTFWMYWFIVLVASVLLIGGFEGIYNHLIKNLLFFSNINYKTLLLLFPPPTYEMPNNFFFEFTGVLQAVLAMILWLWFIRLTKGVLKSKT